MSAQTERRGLGPFTGRQLTTIIVAVIVAVAIPTGAYAISATQTEIVGPVNGPANVTPAGAVQVAEAAPSNFYQTAAPTTLSASRFVPIATAPAGRALIVTIIHIETTSDQTPGGLDFVELLTRYPGKGGVPCSTDTGTYDEGFTPGGIGEIDVPLAPGLTLPSGTDLCAISRGRVIALVSVSGYTIPSSAAAFPANGR